MMKYRATKIIQFFSTTGKNNGTPAYGEVLELYDVVQSVGLHSIAAFCFEDATGEGGLRFWLGKVLRMGGSQTYKWYYNKNCLHVALH